MDPHVAVLVLDTPIAGVAESFGDFGDNTIDLLEGGTFGLVKYQIAFDITTAEDNGEKAKECARVFSGLASSVKTGLIKGVILTGSRSDSFAEGHPWISQLDKFIQTTLFNTSNFPVVGLCFGHQILAKNLGSKVNRNSPENGWEAGTTTISLNKSILDIPKSPFRPVLVTKEGKFMEHINLIEFHRDVVYGLPPASTHSLLFKTSFQNLGTTPKCSIQGLVTDTGPFKLLTFQGHPEFSTPEALTMIELMSEEKRIDKAVFERLTYNTKNLENQGHLVGKVIREFIESYV